MVPTFQEWFTVVKISRVEDSTTARKVDHLPKLLDSKIDIKGSFVPCHNHSLDLALCQQSKGMGTNVCGLESRINYMPMLVTTELTWYDLLDQMQTITPCICKQLLFRLAMKCKKVALRTLHWLYMYVKP